MYTISIISIGTLAGLTKYWAEIIRKLERKLKHWQLFLVTLHLKGEKLKSTTKIFNIVAYVPIWFLPSPSSQSLYSLERTTTRRKQNERG
jgi:hypothetical protein